MGMEGGAGIAGEIISSAFNAFQAAGTQHFQKMMSNTAHQREVKDLRAAGLNPILSATGGRGASTPEGATPAPMQNPLKNFVTDSATSSRVGIEKSALANATRVADADVSLKNAQTKNVDSQTALNALTGAKIQAETTESTARLPIHSATVGKLNQDIQLMARQIEMFAPQKAKLEAETALAGASAGAQTAHSALMTKQGEFVDLQKTHQNLLNIIEEYKIPGYSNQARAESKFKTSAENGTGDITTFGNFFKHMNPFMK